VKLSQDQVDAEMLYALQNKLQGYIIVLFGIMYVQALSRKDMESLGTTVFNMIYGDALQLSKKDKDVGVLILETELIKFPVPFLKVNFYFYQTFRPCIQLSDIRTCPLSF
jgi:hypothetical protein